MSFHSQGNVSFSWEDKPGVSMSSKVNYCPIGVGSYALTPKILVDEEKVPPQPPFSKQPFLKRSDSVEGLRWWAQDPFLFAYKE
ncbi:Detected protein of unknown function [Hibiscus syriacus]|uniref:Uncharacterized protein n=1 Tax=Hibiscus syriacus TaxID=106335 RepID=A0A6A3AMD0_HIBSY|nr:Detected protein of unknown function [Hibiscus syriacus]